ncbi:MAG: RDD family protein [Acidimicrobiales bacterium]
MSEFPSPAPGWGGDGAPPAAGYGYPESGKVDSRGRPYASWIKRVGASLIDALVVGVPSAVINGYSGADIVAVDPVTSEISFNITGATVGSWALVVALSLAYFAILEGGRSGQTVGKRALGIQVRDALSGEPIGIARALGRRVLANLLWYMLFIPGLLDVLWPLWDARRQTWHDKAVNSVVVEAG